MVRVVLATFLLVGDASAQESLYALGPGGPTGSTLRVLNASTGNTERALAISGSQAPFFWGATCDGTRLLVVDMADLTHPDQLLSIHPADGIGVVKGPTGGAWNFSAVEYDGMTGLLHAIYNDRLFTIDPNSGVAVGGTLISGLKHLDGISAMAIDSTGQAWGIGLFGPSFYRLDLATATATHLGDIAIDHGVVGIFMDLTFSSSDQLWASFDADKNGAPEQGLYTLDPSTLALARVITLDNPYPGLAFGPSAVMATYCAPKQNSLSCTPSIQGSGYPSPTATRGFVLDGTNVRNNTYASLFYGIAGRTSLPFHGGTLCLAGPLLRTKNLVNSGGTAAGTKDCSGRWTVDFNTYMNASATFAPGTTVNCQWIGRDGGFAPPNGISLTDALEFVLMP